MGMDRAAAQEAFSGFLSNRSLTTPQIRFIEMVIDQLTHGAMRGPFNVMEPLFPRETSRGDREAETFVQLAEACTPAGLWVDEGVAYVRRRVPPRLQKKYPLSSYLVAANSEQSSSGILRETGDASGIRTAALCGQILARITFRQKGYHVSQRERKLVEQVFGWMKTFGWLTQASPSQGTAQIRVEIHAKGSA